MPDLSEILRLDDQVLDFARDIEVIRSLEILVTTFQERRREIADLGLSDVFEFIASIEDDNEFFDGLNNIGLNGNELKSHVAKVSGALGKISDQQRKLIQPLSEFDEQENGKDQGLVDWSILDTGTTGAGGDTAEYSFSLGAEASLSLEAGDSWPQASPQLPGDLLRLGIAGALSASGNAKIPLNAGSVRIGTKNSLSSSIDYFFSPKDSDQIYASAVARSLDDLCNPFALDSVWKAIARSDLSGVIAQVDGSTSLDVEIGIAEGFTIAKDIADASIGFTVGAHVSRSSEYDMSLVGLPSAGSSGQKVQVILSRNKTSSRGSNISLGVEIDMAALANRLREILKRHQQAFADVLAEYEDYLTPGTYLRDKLSSELNARINALTSDRSVQDALKEAFKGALGLEQRPRLPALKQLIAGQITERLDEMGEVVTGRADLVAEEVVQKIADNIGIDATDTIDSLVTEVTSLVTSLQDDLTTKVSELADSALDGLVKNLEKAGAKVSDAVAKADAALKGVREVIGKYETLLKKLIGETENAARAKITAKLTREETRTTGQVIDVSMTISANTSETQKAFKSLVRGDMDSIIDMLRNPVSGVQFDRENMELARFAKLDRKIGFDVVLLGFEFSTQTIFDADARVSSDGAGRVSVTTNATWTKRKSTKKEEREVQFVDAFELAAASATRQLNIDLSISHQDQDLHADELKKFLRGFERTQLLGEGTTDRALEVLRAWNLGRPAKKVKADIDLALRLDQKSSIRLLQQGDRTNGALSSAASRNLFRIAYRELVESGAYKTKSVVRSAETVLGVAEMGNSKPLIDVLYDYTPQLHRRIIRDPNLSPTFNEQVVRNLNRAHRLHELCMGFVEFVDIMGDVYEAKPVLMDDNGWTEAHYLGAQKELNARIRSWLKIKSRWVFWIGDEAHPRTLAFVGALIATASLGSGADSNPALSLTLLRRNGGGEVVTLT